MPGKLLAQLHQDYRHKFVVNRGFETHLNIYPRNVWDRMSAQINKLSAMDSKSRNTMRFILAGATFLDLDSADRLLISKQQKLYGEIDKKVVLLAYKNKIEIWSEDKYLENFVKTPDMSSGQISEEILLSIDDNIDVLDT